MLRVEADGWIYLVTEAGTDNCKIGITFRDEISRVQKLQTGNPRKLAFERLICGSREVESALHKALRPYRVAREWFAPADLVRLIFDNLEELLVDQAEELVEDEGHADFDAWMQAVAEAEDSRTVVTPAMARAAAADAIAYWQSEERVENEADMATAG